MASATKGGFPNIQGSCLAVSSLVAHAGLNPEAQRELKLQIAHVLNNAPAGTTIAQKQLALIGMLEELAKAYPVPHQSDNILGIIATFLVGARAGGDLRGAQRIPPGKCVMANSSNKFTKYAGTVFEAYILPIIPADAKLKEGSTVSPEMRGKVPGKWLDNVGAWVGFSQWQTHRASPLNLDIWEKDWQKQSGFVDPRRLQHAGFPRCRHRH